MVIPFAGLLGAIAVLPLIPATSHWWEHNRNKFYFAAALAAVTLAYYLLLADFPILGHWLGPHLSPPAESGINHTLAWDVLANAILIEYVPFMTLLFSLYTISGGIRIQGDLPAHPLTNSAFLAVGAVLASIIGTTGAAMLLIRPLLETNRERKHVKHTVIFFIFVVCNCGGCLLPTGDPPLFLGYLLGVDFFWTLKLWPAWLFVNGMLIAIYFVWDRFWYYPREAARDIARDETRMHRLRFFGVWPNALLLLAVIVSVALLDPGQDVSRHRLASLVLSPRDRAVGAGRPVAAAGRAAPCGKPTVSTTARSSKWPRCSSASSSACSRRCRSWASKGRNWG